MRKSKYTVLIFLVVIAFFLVGPAITAALFMLLWNWLVPMFWAAAPIINFWAAWGIIVLLSMVFGRVVVHRE